MSKDDSVEDLRQAQSFYKINLGNFFKGFWDNLSLIAIIAGATFSLCTLINGCKEYNIAELRTNTEKELGRLEVLKYGARQIKSFEEYQRFIKEHNLGNQYR